MVGWQRTIFNHRIERHGQRSIKEAIAFGKTAIKSVRITEIRLKESISGTSKTSGHPSVVIRVLIRAHAQTLRRTLSKTK